MDQRKYEEFTKEEKMERRNNVIEQTKELLRPRTELEKKELEEKWEKERIEIEKRSLELAHSVFNRLKEK